MENLWMDGWVWIEKQVTLSWQGWNVVDATGIPLRSWIDGAVSLLPECWVPMVCVTSFSRELLSGPGRHVAPRADSWKNECRSIKGQTMVSNTHFMYKLEPILLRSRDSAGTTRDPLPPYLLLLLPCRLFLMRTSLTNTATPRILGSRLKEDMWAYPCCWLGN